MSYDINLPLRSSLTRGLCPPPDRFACDRGDQFDLQAGDPHIWFSSAVLRLAGVGLPIDFMQRRQVEMVIPFTSVL